MFIKRIKSGTRVRLFTKDGPINIEVIQDKGPNQIKLCLDHPDSVNIEFEQPLNLTPTKPNAGSPALR